MTEATLTAILSAVTALLVLINTILGQRRGDVLDKIHAATEDIKKANGNGDTQPMPPAQ